jgi:hypothetical protein
MQTSRVTMTRWSRGPVRQRRCAPLRGLEYYPHLASGSTIEVPTPRSRASAIVFMVEAPSGRGSASERPDFLARSALAIARPSVYQFPAPRERVRSAIGLSGLVAIPNRHATAGGLIPHSRLGRSQMGGSQPFRGAHWTTAMPQIAVVPGGPGETVKPVQPFPLNRGLMLARLAFAKSAAKHSIQPAQLFRMRARREKPSRPRP